MKKLLPRLVTASLLVAVCPLYGMDTRKDLGRELLYGYRSDYDLINKLWSHRKQPRESDYFLSPYLFIVDKQKARMHLYFYNGDTYYIKSYNILTGKITGDKNQVGDLKTPEGIYFFKKYISGAELDKKYGTLAITTNYPNSVDRINKKNGYGIWLHGTETDNRLDKKYDTEGCVAGANIDVENMRNFIRSEVTPMIIMDKFMDDPSRYSAAPTADMLAFIESWRHYWSTKDLENYISLYDDKFLDPSTGRNKKAWLEHKRSLSKKYSEINISVSNISVYRHPVYSVVQFIQEYKAPGFSTKTLKRLYIDTRAGRSRIISEESIDPGAIRSI